MVRSKPFLLVHKIREQTFQKENTHRSLNTQESSEYRRFKIRSLRPILCQSSSCQNSEHTEHFADHPASEIRPTAFQLPIRRLMMKVVNQCSFDGLLKFKYSFVFLVLIGHPVLEVEAIGL